MNAGVLLRFWKYVEPEPMSGCWLWIGDRDRHGYGRLNWQGPRAAYRLAFEHFVGDGPSGLELDHRCRVRACVNPAHLEAVTHQGNQSRGHFANTAKTHCPS